PIAVKSAPLPALKGWKPRYVNVLGELMMKVLFEQHGVDKPRAERAAAGWGGDRLVVYEDTGGASLAIDLSAWDAEAGALEAADALIEALPSLAGGEPGAYAEKTALAATATGKDGTVSSVERRGNKILVVVGAPSELAPKIRAQAWERWKSAQKN